MQNLIEISCGTTVSKSHICRIISWPKNYLLSVIASVKTDVRYKKFKMFLVKAR